jgi:hypothetical protein
MRNRRRTTTDLFSLELDPSGLRPISARELVGRSNVSEYQPLPTRAIAGPCTSVSGHSDKWRCKDDRRSPCRWLRGLTSQCVLPSANRRPRPKVTAAPDGSHPARSLFFRARPHRPSWRNGHQDVHGRPHAHIAKNPALILPVLEDKYGLPRGDISLARVPIVHGKRRDRNQNGDERERQTHAEMLTSGYQRIKLNLPTLAMKPNRWPGRRPNSWRSPAKPPSPSTVPSFPSAPGFGPGSRAVRAPMCRGRRSG